MSANANNYSMGGAAELAVNVATGTSTSYSSNPVVSTFTGNAVSGLSCLATQQTLLKQEEPQLLI
jgi:hypothetical protein